MNIRDRIRVAAGALLGVDVIANDMRRQIESAKAGITQSVMVSYGKTKSPETNYESLVKSGWRKNELIYACVSKKAATASQIALRVYSGTGKKAKEIEQHPLRQLIRRPNPHMTESDFWASIIVQQDFAGVAYFEKVRSRAGTTVQLWPMRPDWVRPSVGSDGQVDGYMYNVPGRSPIAFAYEDILPFKIYDPLNQYFGYPPVAVLSRTGDLDNSATDYIRMIFAEGGVPPGILTTTQPINDAVAQRIRAMYREQYGGYQNWGAPMVLGYDTKYQETGLGVDKMGLEILDARSEVRICLALKVPPVIVGAKIGLERATLSNVREYQRDWYENDLYPIYNSFANVIREYILEPEYGQNFAIEWDFDEVPAFQDDVDKRRTQALEAFKAGAITRNVFNQEWGLDPVGPVGDVYVMSFSVVEVPAKLGLAAMQAEQAEAEPEPEVEEEEPKEEEDEDEDDEEDVKYAQGPDEVKAVSKTSTTRRSERAMRKALEHYFKEQLSRMKKEILKDISARRGGKQEEKTLAASFWKREEDVLYELMLYYVKDVTVRSARGALEELIGRVTLGLNWEAVNQDAIRWAEKHTRAVAAEITNTSMSKFVKNFDSWVQSGEPLDALIEKLSPFYEPWRAQMIAVTETTRAYANGNIEFWKTTNIVKGYDWVIAEDNDVCPVCIEQKANGPYSLDVEPPPAHVNCRCAVRPVLKQ